MRVACRPQTGCNGCGGPIAKGRRNYCGNICEHWVITNHCWGLARAEAMKRDGHRCVICFARKSKLLTKMGRIYGKDHPKAWKDGPLEVNHILPVNGRRKATDCQNHLDNLETLCHDCHQAITKQQRADGLLGGTKHRWHVVRVSGAVIVQCSGCGTAERSHAAAWKRDSRHEICKARVKKKRTKRLRRSRKKR